MFRGPCRTALLAAVLAGCASTHTPMTRAGEDAANAGDSVLQEAAQTLLAEWAGPHDGVPPFDKIDNKLFEPAIARGAELLLAEIDTIARDPASPTFSNTFAAMERTGRPLERVATLFFTMASSRNSPEIQEISGRVQPMLAATEDEITFNDALFARIEKIHATRDASDLSPEQLRVVELTYQRFVRQGAALADEAKPRLAEINQRLAQLFTEFGNRVQGDEDSWVLLKDNQLEGLPASLVAVYRAAAAERSLDGYAVVNTRSAVDPFLTFATSSVLRKKVWSAFVNRGDNGDDKDTNAIITEIVALRAERARLLEYESHAHWRMANTMAKDPARAMDLMKRVWPAALGKVKSEVSAMLHLVHDGGAPSSIEPWDYRHYIEKVRQETYALDQSEFKQYFELNNMIEASYYMAKKLYGFAFAEISGKVPTFHPDVRVFRVTNAETGEHVGLLYRDDFARQYKRSGAWQATYRPQDKLDGKTFPIVSNNNNFAKGPPGEPVLISLDDAETLFHEFGHALHALNNDTTYPSLGRTPRDFVEFPSQVHENWLLTRDVLDKFALHYQTGEKMPQQLIDKMRAAATYNQGFATVEYLAAALVDMTLHMDPKGVIEPDSFERTALASLGMPKEIVMRHRLPQFNHLFTSDSYSAGYYSYLWSDVMAADAWTAFKETGDPWDPQTAAKFREYILAPGDATDRASAYRSFRGRDARVEALLRERGLSSEMPKATGLGQGT